MQSQKILRTILFAVFFCIGAVGLSVSVLCEDLLRYYRNSATLKNAEETLERLKSLNEDYEALLLQLNQDPNLLKRVKAITLRNSTPEPNTVYPEVTPEQLEAARQALMADTENKTNQPITPIWLQRSSRQPQRTALFIAGAFLIVISFVCFRTGKQDKIEIEQN
jgi:hypothetical protein